MFGAGVFLFSGLVHNRNLKLFSFVKKKKKKFGNNHMACIELGSYLHSKIVFNQSLATTYYFKFHGANVCCWKLAENLIKQILCMH